MIYEVRVIQCLKYEDRVVAKFKDLEQAMIFSDTCLRHIEKCSVTINLVNENEREDK